MSVQITSNAKARRVALCNTMSSVIQWAVTPRNALRLCLGGNNVQFKKKSIPGPTIQCNTEGTASENIFARVETRAVAFSAMMTLSSPWVGMVYRGSRASTNACGGGLALKKVQYRDAYLKAFPLHQTQWAHVFADHFCQSICLCLPLVTFFAVLVFQQTAHVLAWRTLGLGLGSETHNLYWNKRRCIPSVSP